MRVEALKVENGFLIPFTNWLANTQQDRILLDVEIVEQARLEEGYSILDELVGFYASERADASVNHDAIIYGVEPSK